MHCSCRRLIAPSTSAGITEHNASVTSKQVVDSVHPLTAASSRGDIQGCVSATAARHGARCRAQARN